MSEKGRLNRALCVMDGGEIVFQNGARKGQGSDECVDVAQRLQVTKSNLETMDMGIITYRTWIQSNL